MTTLAYAYPASPKRPVNLSLSDALVNEAKRFTDNLSGTIEGLMAQFVQTKRQEQVSRQEAADRLCQGWNEYAAKHGSFADEYCSL
jgi:antitoxin CcdA